MPGRAVGPQGPGDIPDGFPSLRRRQPCGHLSLCRAQGQAIWAFGPGSQGASRQTRGASFGLPSRCGGREVAGAGKQGPRPCVLFHPGVDSLFLG